MTGYTKPGVHPLLVIVGWLVVAAAATAVGVLAVRAVGASVVGTTTSPLDQEQVNRALSGSTQASSAPKVSSPAAPAGVGRVLATPGGTIIALCVDGDATLQSWSPAQGYDAEQIHAGPAPTAALVFEADGTELLVRVNCAAGGPTVHTTTQVEADTDQD